MSRTALAALLATVAALAVVAALAALSVAVVAADREAQRTDVIRTALWRLDAEATALVLAEAAKAGEAWLREPELPAPPLMICAVEHAGRLTTSAQGPLATQRLQDLRIRLGGFTGEAAGPSPARAPAAPIASPAEPSAVIAASVKRKDEEPPASKRDEPAFQDDVKSYDYAARQLNSQKRSQGAPSNAKLEAMAKVADVAAKTAVPTAGPVVVSWLGEDLLLSRSRSDGGRFLTVVDWSAWRTELTALVADVLPQAALRPVRPDDRIRLAGIPAAMEPGGLPPSPLAPATWWTLAFSWLIGLGGMAAVLWAAVASVRLAERRSAFVSAVTHELRTPLTALRLHGDLLADPRIGNDPARRAAPVAAVRAGALRLAHLIDNVLDYARLEKRVPQLRTVALDEVVAGLDARLPGLEIPPVPALNVRCDPQAVERILGNLVDNAAKYGAAPYRLEIAAQGRRLRLAVVDHGRGVAPDVAARLFSPFSRSAEAAAGDAPGVGLGLALSRRLARAQGGDLVLEATPGGGVTAALTLRLA